MWCGTRIRRAYRIALGRLPNAKELRLAVQFVQYGRSDSAESQLAVWTQFGRPSGVYIDHTDTIYVADSESWGPDNPAWKKGIRIGSAKTGQVHYFLEDIESRDFAHSGAEGIGVDSLGNVYGGVVRRQMLERHEPQSVQPSRGATWPASRN